MTREEMMEKARIMRQKAAESAKDVVEDKEEEASVQEEVSGEHDDQNVDNRVPDFSNILEDADSYVVPVSAAVKVETPVEVPAPAPVTKKAKVEKTIVEEEYTTGVLVEENKEVEYVPPAPIEDSVWELQNELSEFISTLDKVDHALAEYVETAQKAIGITPAASFIHVVPDNVNISGFVTYKVDNEYFLSSDTYPLCRKDLLTVILKLKNGDTEIPLLDYRNIGAEQVRTLIINDFEVKLLCKMGYDCKISNSEDDLLLVVNK
jgi:hypothetical protein